MIKAAQRLGFTLDEVADLLETAAHRHGRADSALTERARLKPIEVEERIADLGLIKEALQQTIEVGCPDLIACAEAECCPLPFVELTRPGRERAP